MIWNFRYRRSYHVLYRNLLTFTPQHATPVTEKIPQTKRNGAIYLKHHGGSDDIAH